MSPLSKKVEDIYKKKKLKVRKAVNNAIASLLELEMIPFQGGCFISLPSSPPPELGSERSPVTAIVSIAISNPACFSPY